MPYEALDFIGSFNRDVSRTIDPQDTINMYESFDKDSPKLKSLISWPGSKLRRTLPIEETEGVRGSYVFLDRMYFVFGENVYSFDEEILPTIIGTLNTSGGLVSISSNLSEVIFIDGSDGWVWDGSNFTQITSMNFPSDPISVTYLSGRFIVAQGGTNKIYSSAEEDGLTWPALEFAQTTIEGDTNVAVSTLLQRIYVFGNIFTQIFYDAGSTGFPFASDLNISVGVGCASQGSIANSKIYLIWLAKSRNGSCTVWMTDGSNPRKVSTKAVDLQLQELTDPTDAVGFILEINGENFYVISFTTDNLTLLYNIVTQEWTHLSMIDGSRYFANAHAYYNNVHYLANYASPTIYELSREFYSNSDEAIKRTRISRILKSKDGSRMGVNTFEVQFSQGVPSIIYDESDFYTDDTGAFYLDDSGQAYWNDEYERNLQNVTQDPIAYLSVSVDGGKTYGREVKQPLGKVGQYNWRTIWRRIGIGDSFVFKLDVYGYVPLTIVGANIEYEVLKF